MCATNTAIISTKAPPDVCSVDIHTQPLSFLPHNRHSHSSQKQASQRLQKRQRSLNVGSSPTGSLLVHTRDAPAVHQWYTWLKYPTKDAHIEAKPEIQNLPAQVCRASGIACRAMAATTAGSPCQRHNHDFCCFSPCRQTHSHMSFAAAQPPPKGPRRLLPKGQPSSRTYTHRPVDTKGNMHTQKHMWVHSTKVMTDKIWSPGQQLLEAPPVAPGPPV